MTGERILLRCGTLVTDASEDVLRDAALLIEDGYVQSVGSYPALRRSYPLAREYGKRDALILPGLVDAHSHGRGISTVEQGISDAPLEVWLARLTAASALDSFDQALAAAADLISTGVTSAQVIFHSFSGPDEYLGDLIATAEGLKRGGLNVDIALGITDRHELLPPFDEDAVFPDDAIRSLAFPERGMDAAAYFELFDALSGEPVPEPAVDGERYTLGATKLFLGPVAPQWASDNILEGVAERSSRGTRVHTHLLERWNQRSPLYGPSPVEKLGRFGLLDEGLSVAHGVWLGPEEMTLLAERGVAVAHCPGSNTRLEDGTAPVREMLDAGVPVALGLDSNAIHHPPDMFAEMRHARTVAASLDTFISEREALAMATSGGAVAVGRSAEIGTLRPGARADLVSLNLEDLPQSYEDPVVDLVNGASRHAIREVWTNGRACLREGRLVGSSKVFAARARLHAALRRDAVRRKRRLREIEDLEPWFKKTWARQGSAIGLREFRGERRRMR